MEFRPNLEVEQGHSLAGGEECGGKQGGGRAEERDVTGRGENGRAGSKARRAVPPSITA